MDLHLFTESYPEGSCARYAHRLAECVELEQKESLYAAMRLFDNQYDEQRPLCVQTRQGVTIDEITELCREFGIEVREAESEEANPD